MGQINGRTRCEWCGTDPLYIAYHDHEWGVPVHDDRLLFEFLILEGAQAAFMQAVGMVNDHTMDCFRHGGIRDLEQP